MLDQALTDNAVTMSRTNDETLEDVVREHARLVYRIAYSTLRNHHDAEDAVQETFVRILRHRQKLARVEDRKLWIARIAWRVAVDRCRRRSGVPMSEKEAQAAFANLQSTHASAEDVMLHKESSELLTVLIAALPEQIRNALVLSTVHDLTTREAAEVLGTTESSVRSRLFRARQMMKDKLAGLESKYGSRR